MFKDYYALLGVSPQSSAETIRLAYRQLALQCHPDKRGAHTVGEGVPKAGEGHVGPHGAERSAPTHDLASVEFTDVQEAYEVLSDVARRYLYDLNFAEMLARQQSMQAELARQRREQERLERERQEREWQAVLARAKARAQERARLQELSESVLPAGKTLPEKDTHRLFSLYAPVTQEAMAGTQERRATRTYPPPPAEQPSAGPSTLPVLFRSPRDVDEERPSHRRTASPSEDDHVLHTVGRTLTAPNTPERARGRTTPELDGADFCPRGSPRRAAASPRTAGSGARRKQHGGTTNAHSLPSVPHIRRMSFSLDDAHSSSIRGLSLATRNNEELPVAYYHQRAIRRTWKVFFAKEMAQRE